MLFRSHEDEREKQTCHCQINLTDSRLQEEFVCHIDHHVDEHTERRKNARGGDAGDMDRLVIFPQMWQQDGIIGGYRELITIDSENRVGMYRPIPQRDAAQFTTLWMKNIKWQQNIKPIAAKAKFVPY